MPATAASDPQSRYHAGLDGLRALAVFGVLLYHGGVSWAGGGFLGVEAFFVLSGFLITSLLVVEWKRSHTIALGAFWARRARRLLPALFLMVAAVGVYYAVAGPMDTVPDLKGAGISTLLYAGNWHQISTGASYFAASGPTSPLKHTWSLAIEEQFYLFWPLLLVGVFWLVRRRQPHRFRESGGALRLLFAVSVVGAVASAIDTALLFNGGKGLDRVYYGTDTRAGSLLAGAALALGLALLQQRLQRFELPERSRERGRALSIAAAIGLLTVLAAMHFADSDSAWLYPFGLLGVDIAVALVIIAVVLAPQVFVGRLLSTAAAASDRADLLRDLPVALPAVFVARRGLDRNQRLGAARPADRGHADRQRPLVHPARAADPQAEDPDPGRTVARPAGSRRRADRVGDRVGDPGARVRRYRRPDAAAEHREVHRHRAGLHGHAQGHSAVRSRPASPQQGHERHLRVARSPQGRMAGIG